MADASCSGTTPFKRLIDHQTRDVSHHQDRLLNSSPNHSSFRSTPQPGQAQEHFGAFIDGPSQLQLPGGPHDAAWRLAAHAAALEPAHSQFQGQGHRPQVQANGLPAVGDMSNWAADFSMFNTQQQPPPQIQQQPQPQQMNHHMPRMQTHMTMSPSLASPYYEIGPPQTSFGPAQISQMQQPQSQAGVVAAQAQNMEEIDQLMEQFAKELELQDAALQSTQETQQTPLTETTSQAQDTHFTDLQHPELGNLSLDLHNTTTIPEQDPEFGEEESTQETEKEGQEKGKSAVSEAAERLLESVQHEGGEKWQNSVFLSLMRDFRDGRKDIVGDEIQSMDGEGAQG